MIQAQAVRPTRRSSQRTGRQITRIRPGSGSGVGDPSLIATKTKDRATATAAPSR